MSKKQNKAPSGKETKTQTKHQEIATKTPTLIVDLFEAVLQKKTLFLFLGLIGIILFFIFGSFLFGDRLFLFKDIGSDTINLFYPRLYHISDYLENQGLPKWSFSDGMGHNILPTSIGDPFNWLLYAMGKENLAYGIVWVELLKFMTTGVVFYLFLRSLQLTFHSSLIGGLLYPFSGFMLVGSGWYVFSTQGLYIALLLLGFEQLFQKNKWAVFVISVCLIGLNSPFDLYLNVILLFVYSSLRMIDSFGNQWAKYFKIYFTMLGLGLLGVMMSSVMLISSVDQILNSPRVSGEASFFDKLSAQSPFSWVDQRQYLTIIARLFSNDLLGDASYDVNTRMLHFTGWTNYLEAPALYSGIATLVLLPQAIALSQGRKRILFIVGLLLVFLPLFFPYLRYAFWLFSGDYYRTFCLFFSFALIYVAVHAMDLIYQQRKVNLIVLIGTVFFLILLLFIPFQDIQEKNFNVIDGSLRNIIVMFLLANSFVIAGLGFNDYRQTARIAMIGLLCLEIIMMGSYTYSSARQVITKSEFNKKEGYNDFTRDLTRKLKKSDSDFYRVSKYYQSGVAMHGSMNDAKIQEYFGSMSYQSFNQKNYIRFLGDLNIIDPKVEDQTRWAKGLQETPLVQILCSYKYMLGKTNIPNFPGYQPFDSLGDIKVLKNDYYLPLGFTYDRIIDSSTFHHLSKEAGSLKKQICLLKAIVIDNENLSTFKNFMPMDTQQIQVAYPLTELQQDVNNRKLESFQLKKFKESHIQGEIVLKSDKILFFSIPFDPSWAIQVNGKNSKLFPAQLGLMGIPLTAGTYKIELIYQPPYWNLSLLLTIGSTILFFVLLFIKNKFTTRNI